MQFNYQAQQNCRVATERTRTANVFASGMESAVPFGNDLRIADIPAADGCIGQVVLDWEFIHDLDLHLLKVASANKGQGIGVAAEPNPEPNPEPAHVLSSIDLNTFVNVETNELHLKSNQMLEPVVSYRNKVYKSRDGSAQAVLQLDRNAAVHSHKPVENLYLTKKLDPGVYVVGIHNYTQRQLRDGVIGPSSENMYNSFEDFKKTNPGYQMMEKALHDQNAHANDEDGTPEKQEIMTRVDKEMTQGFNLMQNVCCEGKHSHGVHYGVTVYTYPDTVAHPKHPQESSLDELQNLFQSEFFATSECVYNPEANHSGYNAANVLGNTQTSDGNLALSHQKCAHVALLKVTRDGETGNATIVEVKMLAGVPGSELHIGCRAHPGGGAMNTLRMLRMQQPAMVEPFPEPCLQQQILQPDAEMQQHLQP